MNLDESRLGLKNILESDGIDYTDTYYRLLPYQNYLKAVKKYQKADEQIQVFSFTPHKNTQEANPWIRTKERVDEGISEVYEHLPGHARSDFGEGIGILDCDPQERLIRLERMPKKGARLKIRPNTYQVEMQIRALGSLVDGIKECMPLMDLFRDRDDVEWPEVEHTGVKRWHFLDDDGYEGVDRQRKFVTKALGTPDFAFLEGPPGSGKTTVLCELVQQMILRGKRVMICASTHIAVDNLIERLTDRKKTSAKKDMIIARMGSSPKISESIKGWKYPNLVGTVKMDLIRGLEGKRTESSEILEAGLKRESGGGAMEEMIRDCTNVVCGTTIGILQYVRMAGRASEGRFDMLIIDEASKTTFQEFLVPAMHADRWVIVGDTKQLAPYTDDGEIADSIGHVLDGETADMCLDVFLAKRGKKTVVVTEDGGLASGYHDQCYDLGVGFLNAGYAGHADGNTRIIAGSPEEISEIKCPKGDLAIRNPDALLEFLRKKRPGKKGAIPTKHERWIQACKAQTEHKSWGREMGWRLRNDFEDLTASSGYGDSSDLPGEITDMLPRGHSGPDEDAVKRLLEVQQIAFPSILSSIQHGFPRGSDRYSTAIGDGMPEDGFEARHILLDRQYRMHSEIAAFSRKHVYDGEALDTPKRVDKARSWTYSRYGHRLVWMDSRGGWDMEKEANSAEAGAVIAELEEFCRFAEKNPGSKGEWEVAVLTFYRGQERELRKHITRLAGKGHRTFRIPAKNVTIELCTVDSFQGHEADVVFLSMANCRATHFLNNRNRLNVAVTRARYQCVIVGDKKAMSKERAPLKHLARLPGPVEVR